VNPALAPGPPRAGRRVVTALAISYEMRTLVMVLALVVGLALGAAAGR
jgi:hypothetical protein